MQLIGTYVRADTGCRFFTASYWSLYQTALHNFAFKLNKYWSRLCKSCKLSDEITRVCVCARRRRLSSQPHN